MFSPHSLQLAEYSHVRFRMVVTKETTREQLTDSKLYRDIVKNHKILDKNRFKFGDIIEILAEDGSFYAEALVLGSSTEELFIKINNFTDHKKEEKPEKFDTENYSVEWRSPKNKFSLIRKIDKTIFKTGFSSKEEALSFLKNLPS